MKKCLSILPILLLTAPSLASSHPDTQSVGTWEKLKKFDDSKCKRPDRDLSFRSNFMINEEIIRVRYENSWVETSDGDLGYHSEICTGVYNPEQDDWEYFDESTFPSDGHIEVHDFYPIQVGDDLVFYGADYNRYEEKLCPHIARFPLSWGVRFNKKEKKWLPINLENAPEPAGCSSCTGEQIKESLGDKLLVWGGVTTNEACDGKVTYILQNGGGIYDPKSDSWTTMTMANAPGQRNNSLHIWIKERNLWVMYGGRHFFDFDQPPYSDLNIYDIKNDTWKTIQLSDKFAMAGNGFNSIFYRNGNIYFFRNFDLAGGFKYNLDTEKAEWLVVGDPSSPANGYLTYAGHDGKLVFLWFTPRSTPGVAQNLYIFDLDSETWTVSEIPLELSIWLGDYCFTWYLCYGVTVAEGSLFSGPAYYDKESRLYAAFQYEFDTGEWLKIARSPFDVSSFGYFPGGEEIPIVMGNEIYLFGPNGAARFKGKSREGKFSRISRDPRHN